MKITYLRNSGFAIEKDNALVIIDCFDPRRHPLLAEERLLQYDRVTVLASHVHGDHYSPDIFALGNDPAYLLSFDIPAHPGAQAISPGECKTVNDLRVSAFGSTDEGVSFHIVWPDGMQLFHAGDLNNWHWRDESSDAYAQEQQRLFDRELDRIRAAIPQGTLDAACFPVDPRMGTDYYRGAIQFAQALRPKHFVPMHFGIAFAPPKAFFQELQPYSLLHDPSTPLLLTAGR